MMMMMMLIMSACNSVGGGGVTSTVIQHKVVDDFGPVEKPSANLRTDPDKDLYGSGLKDEGIFRRGEEEDARKTAGGISRVQQPLHERQPPFVSETHQTSGHGRGDLLQTGGLEEDPHAPSDRPRPPSNYQSKTFDPTGAGKPNFLKFCVMFKTLWPFGTIVN